MFETMSELSIDELEHHLAESTRLISRITAGMLPAIRTLDAGQVAHLDGARSMDEWLAARLDLDVSTARRLLGLARATDPRISRMLQDGESVDRADAILSLIVNGADNQTIHDAAGHDIAGVRRMAAAHRRITPSDESDAHDARYLHTQPTLDETAWRFWGQLTGTDGHIVDKALRIAIDSLPNNPDTTASQDRADALVAVASEWLSGDVGGHGLAADVFIDGSLAVATGGEAGATVAGGIRVGPNTLSEILCAGTVRINFADQYGSISISPSSRAIPGAVRNRVLRRDGYRCVIAGCNSRSRLQPHHLVAYAQGGSHHPDNLVTVCWYHHHVVIHQQRRRIDPNSPPQRRTFIRESDPARAGP